MYGIQYQNILWEIVKGLRKGILIYLNATKPDKMDGEIYKSKLHIIRR